MSYEYDPRRRRRGRVPPQLRAWVFGRRRRTRARRRYDPDPVRRRRYRARRYDPRRRGFRRPGLWGWLSTAAGVGAFVEQITHKDRMKQANFPGYSVTDKIKFIISSMVGRTTGISVFGGKYPQTINPGGMLNKWLGLGVGMWIAGSIPFLPFRGKFKSIGKSLAIGGALGGLFDQPALQTPEYHPELEGAPLIPQHERTSVWT